MTRLLYNLLFPIGLLFFLPGYLLKMRRRGNYRRNFGQRFGFYSSAVRARLAEQRATWIHAVSVGEVAIGLKLAKRMRAMNPGFRCVLTTTTTTGFAVAEAEAGDWMEVMYHPLDFWPIVRRALGVIQPARIILVEAEVWPNLAAEARARGVPLALVNARLSERSERRFRKFRSFIAPTFRCLDLVCAQEPEDVERWAALGVARDRIKHVGSIKYDPVAENESTVPAEILRTLGIDAQRPILFGGSTHAGEEEILARIFLRLRAEFPALVLIIAARHAERTAELRRTLLDLGLIVALRSESIAPGKAAAVPDCVFLDTTGELRDWYHVATIVFIGKSLVAHGGQNPVEPILAGKPVIFGPHMENFSSLARSLLAHRAAIEVQNADALCLRIGELLRDSDARATLVENAGRVLADHRGATQRTAELVMSLGSHQRSEAGCRK